MILLILLLLTFILLFPYLWGAYHCCRMLRRLKRVGDSNGFRFKRLSGRFAILRNFSVRYDCSMSDGDTVYLIQLLICYHRGRRLLVGRDGRVREQGTRRRPVDSRHKTPQIERRGVGRWRSVPKTLMPSPARRDGRRVVPILLNYPAYEEIVCFGRDGTVSLTNGSILFEKQLYLPSAFEKLLSEKNGSQNSEK